MKLALYLDCLSYCRFSYAVLPSLQSATLKRTLSEEMLDRGKHFARPTKVDGFDGSNKEGAMANNPFYALLGDCYTIVVSERVVNMVKK